MSRSQRWISQFGRFAAVAVLLSTLTTHACSQSRPDQAPTAEEVLRRTLMRHARARNEAENRIIAVMDDMQDNQARGMANILPEDGRLVRMFTEAIEAKKAVEVGKSNGYSAMWYCLALRSTGGKLITHDIDPK